MKKEEYSVGQCHVTSTVLNTWPYAWAAELKKKTVSLRWYHSTACWHLWSTRMSDWQNMHIYLCVFAHVFSSKSKENIKTLCLVSERTYRVQTFVQIRLCLRLSAERKLALQIMKLATLNLFLTTLKLIGIIMIHWVTRTNLFHFEIKLFSVTLITNWYKDDITKI